MSQRSLVSWGLAIGLAINLVACSGEPSENDLTKAMQANIDQLKQTPAGKFMGDDMQLFGVKKLGCQKTEQKNAYLCDVQVDANTPFVGRGTRPGQIRMVKGDDGWVVVPGQ